MKKLLIFGGTFNPVHNGHIYMCRTIADYIKADEVHIVPTFSPVHKDVDNTLVNSEHRLNMCRLAFDRNNEIVNSIEIDKGRPCYSYETLTWLSEEHPDAQLYLACGSDMFLSLHTRRNPEVIFDKAIICAISREENYQILQDYAEKNKDNGLRSIIIEAQPMIVSSTKIRSDIKTLGSYDDLPLAVAEYIRKNRLYL